MYTRIPGSDHVLRDDGWHISPEDASYLAWLDAGNRPADPPEPTLEEAKAARLAHLAERRWRAEIGGTTVNGWPLPSDESAQAKLTAAVLAAQLDANYVVRWKLRDGSFALLDAPTLVSVAQGVRAHVQGCFDHEAELAAQISAAADAAAVAAIDIEAGWPE